MDDATVELYLQKIEEFVHDDDLIVTTEFLCEKLNISIQDAKHLMVKYLTDHRNIKPTELGVHYAILGQLRKDDKFCVILVSESKLSEKLSLYKSDYSKEIYSIQKAVNTDINALNLLNPEPRENALIGSIVGQNCLASKKVKSNSVNNDVAKGKLNTLHVEKIVEKKIIIEKKTSPRKSKIASKPLKNGKGIANLFSKMAENPKITIKKIEEKPKTTDDNALISKPLDKLIDTDNESDEKERVITELSQKPHKITKKTNKKRNRKEESPEKPQKRRKRVIEPPQSDSDDLFGKTSDEEENGHDSSSDEPTFKPQKFDPSAPKNKQKNFVNKTYVDENGYMVTKREWVNVSDSDVDEPLKEQETPNVPINKNVEEKLMKKPIEGKKELPLTATTQKGKGKNAKKVTNQPSILSFFNKK